MVKLNLVQLLYLYIDTGTGTDATKITSTCTWIYPDTKFSHTAYEHVRLATVSLRKSKLFISRSRPF
jgi:hypothetical protein